MTSSDGVRRFKTYGKHRSQVAVSRRDWWSAVGESAGSVASTSTAVQDGASSHGRDGTSPSHRAANKASTVMELDSDEDYLPAPKKQLAVPCAQSRSTNTQSRIVDTNESDSEEEHKPSVSRNSNRSSTAMSHTFFATDTPANGAMRTIAKVADQQRRRVISLSSDTSEESKIKPARRKAAVPTKSVPITKKRIIIDDSPPATPERDKEVPTIEHVHDLQDIQPLGHLKAAEVGKAEPILASPVKNSKLGKPSILSRKDSNHLQTVGIPSSPFKKQSNTPSTPHTKVSAASKENIQPFKDRALASHEQPTLAKPTKTPLGISSKQPFAPRPAAAIAPFRSVTSSKSASSSSSSSASIVLPPPRGHHSESAEP